MRQAGRCLADYRELRERYGILEMARTPELCARVTAMPVDQLGVDVARYLVAQIQAGVDVVQLFDSWAGILSPDDYERSVLPHTLRVFEALSATGAARIHFFTGNPELLSLAARGCDVVSVDWRVSLADAWTRIGADRAIQGNLDPVTCLAPFDVVAERSRVIVEQARGRPGHIFNLGHGVLPGTDPDTLRRVVALVHEATAA